MKKTLLLTAFCLLSFAGFATTWDEPWQEEIFKNSDTFVKLRVLNCDEEKGFEAEIIENIAGATLPQRIKVNDFFLLNLTSMSGGHGPEFHFKTDSVYYFFLKAGKQEGEYAMSTPTSGFAYRLQGGIAATYRHSYHMALVPEDTYVASCKAIFNFLHGFEYDKVFVDNFMATYLKQTPRIAPKDAEALASEEGKIFFSQHVALEMFYYFGDAAYTQDILKFLDYDDFHVHISAVR